MKKSFLYTGFLGLGLLLGTTSVMAQTPVTRIEVKSLPANQRTVTPRRYVKLENTAKVRPVTAQEAKAAVAGGTQTQAAGTTRPATGAAPVKKAQPTTK